MKILIFAKAPVPGKVKTRLIPALGAEGAAALAARMLRDTVAAVRGSGVEGELCCDPAPDDPAWRGHLPNIKVSEQGEGDLGQRLARAAERAVPALLIGTDCPELDAGRLRAAAASLAAHDAVIHPAEDGGYALLGLRRFDPALFSGIAWSTSSVAAATISRIRGLGWTIHISETLRDIDTPEDLD